METKTLVPAPAVVRHAERIEMVPLKDLVPYARNARTHSDAQIRQIAGSIAEFGFTNPVLIDPSNGIVAGHGRVMAAEMLKIPEVPCIRLGWLTDTQRRAYILADNKIALNSSWDFEMLSLEVRDLRASEFELSPFGFDDKELETLGADTPPPPEGDGATEYSEEDVAAGLDQSCPKCGFKFASTTLKRKASSDADA